MSYLFEALQRVEAERSGENPPKNAGSVADLLQEIEQRLEQKESDSGLPPVAIQESAEPVPAFASAKTLLPSPPADSRLVCLRDQGGLAAEKFRVLGLKLRHLRERRKLKRIVITSSVPEEGKSLIAANLALNQSRSKILNTLLIDGDLRRSALGSRFGFNRNLPGLSEVLRGEKQLSEVVYKIEGSGLWFIPAGVIPENPIDLMQSGRLQQLLEQLETFFHWIIIDTPPILPLADTPLLMKLADGVLLVVREGVCDKKQLERAVETIDRSAMLGVVVNSCHSVDQDNYYTRYGRGASEESLSPAPEN
ncbi:MAG: CpsD/CapB family tyrosine-protein kinase [Terriglobales bacterium]